MDLLLLEYFLRVTELGSINKAAGDLQLSQSALSRHMAGIEHDWARPVHRSRRRVFTEAGSCSRDRARPLLRQFAILKEQVGEQAAGQLAIGIPPSWQQVFTSAFVAEMIARHPSWPAGPRGRESMLREHMSSGLLDLCVVPFDTSPAAGYQQTALVREPLVLVGRAVDKLRAKEPVPISRLDGARLVLPARPNVLRAQVEHSLTRKGMIFRLEVETDTLTLCLDLARRGLGLTVVPACSMPAQSTTTRSAGRRSEAFT